jgi:hypothetical protein
MIEVIETLKNSTHINILCGQNLESPRIKPGGILTKTAL